MGTKRYDAYLPSTLYPVGHGSVYLPGPKRAAGKVFTQERHMKRLKHYLDRNMPEICWLLFFLMIAAALLITPMAARAQSSGNVACSVIAAGVKTSTSNSADLGNTQWRGVHFIVNVSSYTSGTWIPKIQGKDSISGNYYDILVGPTISGAGATVMKVYPGLTAGSNVANDILPRTWRGQMGLGVSPASANWSVSCSLVM